QDAIRPARVIREQQQPLTLHVQAPHCIDPRHAGWKQVVYGGPAELVRRCGHTPGRLVHHQVDTFLRTDPLTIHVDTRASHVDAERRVADHATIHAHTSRRDERLTFRTRAPAE